MEHTLFIGIGVVILLLFSGSISVIHLRTLRDDINKRWYNLADKLQYRQDLIPNLIETIRLHSNTSDQRQEDKSIIQKTIAIRHKAGVTSKPGSNKMIIEHDLSKHIKKLLDISLHNKPLGRNTNFLELKKQLKDIEYTIEEMAQEYNAKVRNHNRTKKKFYNAIPAFIMRYSTKKIFEFE
ncbi:hypothetical protein GF369_00815 [Candidatus Peregrinibacteria bacterium]|nr:hypothetical protein [Candidatus Peregrinibacteria bacterium]